MSRTILPSRRPCEMIEFEFRGVGHAAAVGRAFDPSTGRVQSVAKLFLDCHKLSSDLTALARDAAVSISLALQEGCSLETLAGAVTRSEDGSAAGLAGAALDAVLGKPPALSPISGEKFL